MGDKKRSERAKKKKRRFHGHKAKESSENKEVRNGQPNVDIDEQQTEDNPDGDKFMSNSCFFLRDVELLNPFVAANMRCPECTNFSVTCGLDLTSKLGFCLDLVSRCMEWSWTDAMKTSKEVGEIVDKHLDLESVSKSGKKQDKEIHVRMVTFVERILEKLGVSVGTLAGKMCGDRDHQREKDSCRTSLDSTKKRRKTLRAIRKGFQDTTNDKEGDVYNSGGH
ncbi:hypothetical protein PoB_005367600 [Plakobranchus ocellatus]|uniref:Uncharacterized protein n=1 Tax=Plakobranchus ocellatus TaxID=259542 RepID=A0AAV4C337_9GAST|nr:hypothetical protein PoB_005367600 [Plakobranchus ocellatus]